MPRSASSSSASVSGSARRRDPRRVADRLDEPPCLGRDVVPLLLPGLGHGEQELRERRHSVPRLRREVGAGVERLARGRQEDRHRPAALTGHRHRRVHVERVDVGALLAIDLDVDEMLVHQRSRGLVLERLVCHHMAPVAGAVAHREENRPVLLPRALERVGSPWLPVDGVVGVLEEVRARLGAEAIHHTSLRRRGTVRRRAPGTNRARFATCPTLPTGTVMFVFTDILPALAAEAVILLVELAF